MMNQFLTREALAVHFPLLVFLAVIAHREVRTGRITNKSVLLGLIYFAGERLTVGPHPPIEYLVGGIGAFSIMLMLYLHGWLGAGAVKLAAVFGVALGSALAIFTACLQVVLFLLFSGLAHVRENRRQRERAALAQFVEADNEQLRDARATERAIATSPFTLVVVLGVLALKWAHG